MNYYDRIQKSIEFIEDNLDGNIEIEDAAGAAKMCNTEYARFFYAVTGYTVQDYIGKRKISLAVKDIKQKKINVTDLTKKYCFSSTEAFGMIFRSNTGYLPSEYQDQNINYSFSKIDVREMYYGQQDPLLIEKFPDIRLLKPTHRMRVAAYTSYGKEPENDACEVIMEYVLKNNLLCRFCAFRIFGFTVPDSIKSDGTYKYTVCITVGDNHVFSDGPVKEMILEKGQYVVASTTVSHIVETWERFKEWLHLSGYSHGSHQYLEEHLLCCRWREKEPINDIEINLYMPVKIKNGR
ncbi:MAG: helix-turn-helix domain-containing protein [Clostridia bacterium]